MSTRNPLNIGAAARAMSNFGFSSLRVVNPYEPSFREAKSAVGASKVLAAAQQYSSIPDAVADCTLVIGTTAVRNRELHHPLKLLAEGAKLIRRRMASQRVALLFGSEKRGLSNRDLSYCHWLLHVPTKDAHISMNLGQAVAVCLYELSRSVKSAAKTEKRRVANTGEVDRITNLLLEILQSSGYFRSHSATAEEKVQRLIRRLNLSEADAELWLGIMRQIGWKIRRNSD